MGDQRTARPLYLQERDTVANAQGRSRRDSILGPPHFSWWKFIIIIILLIAFVQDIYNKPTMFPGYIALQLFCIYNLCYM
jgi:hypothetical protein